MRFEKSDEDIVCVSAVRTPFGRFGGSLRDMDIYDLGAMVMKEVMDRVNIDPALIGEVWWGIGDTTNTKDPYTPVVARQSLLKAGIPPETPSVSFDQACTSAMTAAMFGTRSVKSGSCRCGVGGRRHKFQHRSFSLAGNPLGRQTAYLLSC